VFVVVPSTPDGDAASHLLYKCVVPLFFSTHFFIGSVFLFVYFLSFAVPWVGNREQNFQNWFFPFFFVVVCCCSRETCFMLQPLRLSGVISFHHVVLCVCTTNQRVQSNKASFPPHKRATYTQTQDYFSFSLYSFVCTYTGRQVMMMMMMMKEKRKQPEEEEKKQKNDGGKGGACGLPASYSRYLNDA
jgi:cytochrome bd-type quinol oxidase subunit 1